MLVKFLVSLSDNFPDRVCLQAIDAIAANTKAFAPDALLTPTLLELQELEDDVFSEVMFVKLRTHAVSFLKKRSSKAPAIPKDWAQKAEWRCSCADCQELKKFTKDPAAQELRMRLAKERRRHLHGVIDRNKLDMSHVTERRGSPLTLVLTKRRTAYDAKRLQYERYLSALDDLE
ncbi:MAG: hypothetical protein ACI8T1_002605 [Verrucomicrobiales bacterium]|jgi:hypothetical protein